MTKETFNILKSLFLKVTKTEQYIKILFYNFDHDGIKGTNNCSFELLQLIHHKHRYAVTLFYTDSTINASV